ncbi:hypothetical protein ACFYZI_41800 [Streptomyces griseorubiginosus]|uniref:hypothetical protein n=1 Tax=Streptomyces griseorubiginosus TaxID=67304 RepID=UPI0036C5356C
MTADSITAGQRLAGELIRMRLADRSFAARLHQRFRTWEVDRDAFLAQVESVVLIALLATADELDASTSEAWCLAAAVVLRQQQNPQLFAALPTALPDSIKLRVEQLRMLSTGLTPRSGHRWLRLTDTACEFLEPVALIDEGR